MFDMAYEVDFLRVNAGSRCLLDCQNLHIPANRITAVIGPNGAGKSTLLRALAGFNGERRGKLFGQPLDSTPRNGHQIAWVAQHEGADSPLKVRDYVMLGRRPHLGWFRRASELDHEAVNLALSTLELTSLANSRLSTLSGGERQRAAIARAMAQATPVVLLDEPTNHLDIRHQHILLRWLSRLALTGRTVVSVLHDLDLAANYAHWLVLVDEGKILAQGTPEQVLNDTLLSRAYRWDIRTHHDRQDGNWLVNTFGQPLTGPLAA